MSREQASSDFTGSTSFLPKSIIFCVPASSGLYWFSRAEFIESRSGPPKTSGRKLGRILSVRRYSSLDPKLSSAFRNLQLDTIGPPSQGFSQSLSFPKDAPSLYATFGFNFETANCKLRGGRGPFYDLLLALLLASSPQVAFGEVGFMMDAGGLNYPSPASEVTEPLAVKSIPNEVNMENQSSPTLSPRRPRPTVAVKRNREPPRNSDGQICCDHPDCKDSSPVFRRPCEWK